MALAPHAGALLLALLIDAHLGDPVYPWHPVRLMGHWISKLEKDMYPKGGTPGFFQLMGGFLVMYVVLLTFAIYSGFGALLYGLTAYGPGLRLLAILGEALLIYQLLAARCLWDEGRRILQVMSVGDLVKARQEIGYLVSRETKDLTPTAIYKAAVETLTENITDGIVAPLFYYVLFGLPGMATYKCINTMDSMIGYKNERYLNFGRLAARLDDFVNLLPARMAAGLILIWALLARDNWSRGLSCFWRHRRYHSSPNAGCTESAMAGALDIQLSGPTTYFGALVERPYIGFVNQPICEKHLIKAMGYIVGVTAMTGVLAVIAAFGMGRFYGKF